MLESILQLSQSIQAQNFKFDKRLSSFELDIEEVKSAQPQALQPAVGTSSCPCSDFKQSLALVHSRLDTMVTAIEATNAKVDLLNRRVNATKSESAKANSDITSATQMLIK